MKEIIFFDLDGTLTDSMPGITRAVQYVLRQYGITVEDLNVLIPFVGPPLQDSFKEYYNFSQKDADEAVHFYREYYNVKGWMENSVYDGIEGLLKELRAVGKKLFVATSKPDEIAKQILGYFELDHYFEFIGGASEDGARVNKDDVIRHVLDCCRLKNAESIVMVGDRRHDIAGAHRAGLEAVGVLYGYGSERELQDSGADWITADVAGLKKLLLEL